MIDLAGLAEAVATAEVDDAARHAAGRCLVDWAGCALAGSAHPAVEVVARSLDVVGAGDGCTLAGRGGRAEPLPPMAMAAADGGRIACPTLMITGEYDPLCHLEDAMAFYDTLAGPKEMWIFENEFHRASQKEAIAGLEIYHFEADWLKDALEGRLAPDHRAIRLVRQAEGPGVYVDASRSLLLPGRAE